MTWSSTPNEYQAVRTSEPEGFESVQVRSFAKLVRPEEMKKLLPMGIMLFCVLFNYTILRSTKDVLVVTAPGSGAEVIPFLKTYIVLPGSIIFTMIYSALCNRLAPAQVFYATLLPLLAFYVLFAFALYPNRLLLHPDEMATAWTAAAPNFAAPLSILRNWSFSAFYLFAELWGSVVLSVLFWGLANTVMNVQDAKKYYPLFGIGANLALVVAGQVLKASSAWATSALKVSVDVGESAQGDDVYGVTLKLLMGAVAISGAVMVLCHEYIQRCVMTDPSCVDLNAQRKSKMRTRLGFADSFKSLTSSRYIRNLAALVIAYGMAINIVEVTWKGRLRVAYPDASAYSTFLGNFSTATGAVTILMMFTSRIILNNFGWGVAAMITPTILLATGVGFFSLILAPGAWSPVAVALGTTPLMLAVLLGAVQNILSKSSKYSLFDPCKEMAFIPLSAEEKTKGKAAIDVIANPLGKSAGSMVQQVLLLALGSLAAATPFLAIVLLGVIVVWLRAVASLNRQFEDAMEKEKQALLLIAEQEL